MGRETGGNEARKTVRSSIPEYRCLKTFLLGSVPFQNWVTWNVLSVAKMQAHRKYHGGEAISINLEDNGIRKQGARFLCNVRFKNDLPEVRACSLF